MTDKFEINERVRVIHKEWGIDMTGSIYEMSRTDNGIRIYGIRFDKPVYAGGLCTEVWHCQEYALEEI